jgi:hypothetical protein
MIRPVEQEKAPEQDLALSLSIRLPALIDNFGNAPADLRIYL